jgi:alpha-glucosidase
MSMGTRMHQAAMFIVYESPIQLFSGNPSQGLLEPAFMQLVGSLPTVWDETIVLDGAVGEYIITARKKDNNWYVAGMTNWTGRTVSVDFSFLEDGDYEATVALDGMNADRYPSDYTLTKQTLSKKLKLNITMARGGFDLPQPERFFETFPDFCQDHFIKPIFIFGNTYPPLNRMEHEVKGRNYTLVGISLGIVFPVIAMLI